MLDMAFLALQLQVFPEHQIFSQDVKRLSYDIEPRRSETVAKIKELLQR